MEGFWFHEQVCCFVYLIKVLKLLVRVPFMTILSLLEMHCKLQVPLFSCKFTGTDVKC